MIHMDTPKKYFGEGYQTIKPRSRVRNLSILGATISRSVSGIANHLARVAAYCSAEAARVILHCYCSLTDSRKVICSAVSKFRNLINIIICSFLTAFSANSAALTCSMA